MYGKALIVNDDEDGGITICTKGYLNFVCGQERVDIVGKYTEKPESEAKGTWTNMVFQPQPAGKQNVDKPGGTYYLETEGSYVGKLCTKEPSKMVKPDGFHVDIEKGDRRSRPRKVTGITWWSRVTCLSRYRRVNMSHWSRKKRSGRSTVSVPAR
jgi:hypothetical protein